MRPKSPDCKKLSSARYNRVMEDSIFTKIIRGEIPCHKVYEDDKTLAFLDINPIQPGQVLVVSKSQVDHLMDLDDTDYEALWAAVRKISQRMREVFTDKDRIGVQVEGLEVPHAHVKLIPFNTTSEFHAHPTGAEPDHDALVVLAQKLAI